MRYLQMISNALAGGALGAAFVTIVVLQLNPHLGLDAGTVLPLYGTMALYYGVHLAVIVYGVTAFRRLTSRRPPPAGWISMSMLAWLGAALTVAAAALMWANLTTYRLVLGSEAVHRMTAGAVATTVSGALLVVLALVHYAFSRRGGRVGATLVSLTIAAGAVLPVVARGHAVHRPLNVRPLDLNPAFTPSSPGGQVVLMALDGASLEYITEATAQGRLPHFGRMLDGGAALHLSTVHPTQPAPVWAAVATGKYAPKNGVRSAAAYAFRAEGARIELLPDLCFAHGLVHWGFLDEVPHSASALRARTMWDIASGYGISVGVAGWPLTSPAQPVRGYLITDRFHLGIESPLEFDDDQLGYPAAAVNQARRLSAAARAVASLDPSGLPLPDDPADDVEATATPPTARDRWYRLIAGQLGRDYAPRFMTLRYDGLDVAGHRFLRYAQPHDFGDVSDAERLRYGQVLDRYYDFIDAELGDRLATLGPADVLLVVSAFGMEPVSPGKRLLARVLGEADVTGTHERAPDGFLLAYGGPVAPARLPLGSVVDVAPTVLYLLGLPLARDLDGDARTDLFASEFTAPRPITVIPAYR